MWHHSIVIAEDGDGNFYKIETQGPGIGLKVGWIAELQEKVITESWNVNLQGSLGLIDTEIYGRVTGGSGGVVVHSGQKPMHFAGFDPGLELYGTWTTTIPIAKESIWDNMPMWVMNAFKKAGRNIGP